MSCNHDMMNIGRVGRRREGQGQGQEKKKKKTRGPSSKAWRRRIGVLLYRPRSFHLHSLAAMSAAFGGQEGTRREPSPCGRIGSERQGRGSLGRRTGGDKRWQIHLGCKLINAPERMGSLARGLLVGWAWWLDVQEHNLYMHACMHVRSMYVYIGEAQGGRRSEISAFDDASGLAWYLLTFNGVEYYQIGPGSCSLVPIPCA